MVLAYSKLTFEGRPTRARGPASHLSLPRHEYWHTAALRITKKKCGRSQKAISCMPLARQLHAHLTGSTSCPAVGINDASDFDPTTTCPHLTSSRKPRSQLESRTGQGDPQRRTEYFASISITASFPCLCASPSAGSPWASPRLFGLLAGRRRCEEKGVVDHHAPVFRLKLIRSMRRTLPAPASHRSSVLASTARHTPHRLYGNRTTSCSAWSRR